MKRIIILLFLSAGKLLLAQENQYLAIYTKETKVSGGSRVEYAETHLYIKNRQSYSINIPDKSKNRRINEEGQNTYIRQDSSGAVYKDFVNSQVIFYSHLPMFVKGYFNDTLHPMSWVISEDTKKIDSLTCQRATSIFRGRTYSAWFCADIPIPNGPSKFGGLPGLIVELYDSENYVHFKLQQFKPTNQTFIIPAEKYPGYPEFITLATTGKRHIEKSIRASNADGNCLSCNTTFTMTVTDLENVFGNE